MPSATRGDFTVDRINQIEAEVRHDVIAFTTTVAEHIDNPDASRWLHYGLTSTDVVDTAQALQLKAASSIIRAGIVGFSEVLRRRAIEFQHTPSIGRTHGIHAEPTTFGLKLLLWYAEMQRNLARFDAAAEDLRVGKLSGAVGTFGHLKPEHEEAICSELGLKPVPIATQVVQRDRHAAYLATLAVLCSTLDKIATEIRHLQRTEVREAEEFFSEKQKGSSAMPHKRNPITSEQISGLARVVRSNAQAGFENVALWHERDISHSSAERVILPDSTILADYLLTKSTNLIDKLLVYPARMLKNLESTGGLIFSGQLLLDLAESGMSPRRRIPSCPIARDAQLEGRPNLPRRGHQRPSHCAAPQAGATHPRLRLHTSTRQRRRNLQTRPRPAGLTGRLLFPLLLPLHLPFLSVIPEGNLLLSLLVFAVVVALALLSVVPEGNLLLPLLLPLHLPFCLSFPKGICCCLCCCPCTCPSVCHSRRESAVALALAPLSVIPEGNLLLPLHLPPGLSFPKGICCCCAPVSISPLRTNLLALEPVNPNAPPISGPRSSTARVIMNGCHPIHPTSSRSPSPAPAVLSTPERCCALSTPRRGSKRSTS